MVQEKEPGICIFPNAHRITINESRTTQRINVYMKTSGKYLCNVW